MAYVTETTTRYELRMTHGGNDNRVIVGFTIGTDNLPAGVTQEDVAGTIRDALLTAYESYSDVAEFTREYVGEETEVLP